MIDKSCGYKVTFSVEGITLKEQEEIYDLLRKNLSFDMKDHFDIVVEDPVGGKHYLWRDTGINPDGKECKKCATINCAMCYHYKGGKNGK